MDLAGKIKPWSRYLQPSREIDPGASRVNRLTLVNDKLCYNGIACKNVVPQEAGINIFFEHISKYYPDGVTLVAHNGFRFDFPLIKRDLRKYRFDEKLGDQYQIKGLDSLEVFRKQFPRLSKHNQPHLVEQFLGPEKSLEAHEAIGDCVNLKCIIETAAKEKGLTVMEFLGLSNNRTFTIL